ncbi:hypothetical protein [Nocardia rhizosphaerae]|uniref:Uncharacterized protein n=1 Tax=Nocardia rhizosphaerae TaxID=1691571 RepID=A0ABV8LEG4_9NOCA
MSDRDTLIELIDDTRADGHSPSEAADYLLDAGWRPPAREITDPAELDALLVGSVVRDSADQVLRRAVVFVGQAPAWEVTGYEVPFSVDEIRLPVTVLFDATEES